MSELEADLIGFILTREINHQWKVCAISPGRDCHFSFGLPESDEPISIERNPTTCVLCSVLFNPAHVERRVRFRDARRFHSAKPRHIRIGRERMGNESRARCRIWGFRWFPVHGQ